MDLENYNRIINLYFLDSNNVVAAMVKCGKTGRKPNIEITGQFTEEDVVPVFNITIKNFYLNRDVGKYQKLRVEAGYQGNLCNAFEGTIFYMYTETPGPDATTVIQCGAGNFNEWLTQTVNINLPAGYSLKSAITLIADKVGCSAVYTDSTLQALTSKAPLQEQGFVRQALFKLKEIFNIDVAISSNQIIVSKKAEESAPTTVPISIDFMSAPMQIVGGAKAQSTVTITAPWNPKIKIGDLISFPTKYYTTTGYALTTSGNKGIAQVISLQFHFSTAGRVNQMVITAAIKGGSV